MYIRNPVKVKSIDIAGRCLKDSRRFYICNIQCTITNGIDIFRIRLKYSRFRLMALNGLIE